MLNLHVSHNRISNVSTKLKGLKRGKKSITTEQKWEIGAFTIIVEDCDIPSATGRQADGKSAKI